jgi:hypothetical protein
VCFPSIIDSRNAILVPVEVKDDVANRLGRCGVGQFGGPHLDAVCVTPCAHIPRANTGFSVAVDNHIARGLLEIDIVSR